MRRMVSIGWLLWLSLPVLASASQALAEASVACPGSALSRRSVSVNGDLRHIAIDPSCRYVYVSNATNNRIEVFSLTSSALEQGIQVGAQPVGFDFSVDGSTLYVANSGGSNISVVDLAARSELRKIIIPSGFSNDRPFSLAVASNGLAFVSTTFSGSGFGGRMLQVNPATDAVSLRSDFFVNGSTTEATSVVASGDRSTLAAVAGDISSGPVFVYRSSGDAFRHEKDLNAFVSQIATDHTGSVLVVNPGTYVVDAASLSLNGTIPGGGFGVAVDPSGATAYRVVSGGIETLALTTFLVTGSTALPDTVADAANFRPFGVGRMAISPDGRLLAVITDHGFSLVPAKPSTLVAAVLPSSRSVQVGSPATAFATVINVDGAAATECAVTTPAGLPASFMFQTTDAANQLVGSPNQPVTIAAGGQQSFLIAFTPTTAFAPTDVAPIFACAGGGAAAPRHVGVNTLLLSASATPVPDIVALSATVHDDGIVDVPGTAGTGAFAVAIVNVGTGTTITASADSAGAGLPLSTSVCRTDPATGQCMSDPTPAVTAFIDGGATATYAMFVRAQGSIPFDPAHARVFSRFTDPGGVTRGLTSVAARTVVPDIRGTCLGSSVISQFGCSVPQNNGVFTAPASITIASQSGSTFAGSALRTNTVSGVATRTDIAVTGTVSEDGVVTGDFTFVATANGTLAGSGDGRFTGSITPTSVSINVTGQFHSGETCLLSGSLMASR